MRIFVMLAALSLVSVPASAQDRPAFFEGFGGLRVTTAPGVAGTLGGTFGAAITPGIQIVGEVGRMSDVTPETISTILGFTPVEFRVSAVYGEGGLRFITNPRSHISAYGETLAGMTRLNARLGGIGSERTTALVNAALRFLNTTEPVAGVGGGLIIQGGPLVATVGYRFNRIFARSVFTDVLSGGSLDTNELRVGIGVRF